MASKACFAAVDPSTVEEFLAWFLLDCRTLVALGE